MSRLTCERKIVRLRKQFPFMGAQRLQQEHNLPCSHQAVARVLKHYGLTRKRQKKQQRKKKLAHIKRRWTLFGQISVDTKDCHQRVASFQAAYNLVRPNRNKQNLTPWQIVQKEWPTITFSYTLLQI